MSAESVFTEMGLNYQGLMRENPAYENTCAVRMSLALLKSGVSFAGRMTIRNGPYKKRHRVLLENRGLWRGAYRPNRACEGNSSVPISLFF